MTTTNTFELPGSYKKWTIGLIAAGVIALLYGVFMFHPWEVGHGGEHIQSTRFWSVLLQNSVFFLLIVNASMFFIGVTTLAQGGWQVALKRVPEAISSVVPVLGLIAFVILMSIVWGGHHDIYHWVDKDAVAHDHILNGKKGFLNPVFFSVWSAITVLVWWLLGKKLRQLSLDSDKGGTMDYETGKKWIDKNFLYSSLFIVFFGLTVGSTIPWLWIMSIDAHWYSTMFSWYTFASSFVSGMSLIAIFVIFLKNRGQLPYVTDEHIHDVGKFMFAFSIFWTYLWFSQYMLIWYANIPEETGYFKIRVQGPFRGIFFLNLIMNFVLPFLILMKKSTKRNWTILTVTAVLIIFGHWIDFWQMVMPGTLKDHAELMPFEFGIAALFIGIIMWRVGAFLTKHPLTAKNHPYLKESMIHHT
ncbi:quinol:cytochrome C oxidoreductase [Ferruginibacter lapsinanis]|uniref:quinol:cytochrome C oxidoreductase n=1 Tax=Ferruginibacter lapsinanis TaxID=563172 RepID=UPI001E39DC06|nr:quinol:cytochrome C oxidoreductase [Ferruginibacter lapsinanis]UEG50697.1 quinol:cytochrome C oxidoreductase [Ferruginibacter lapsinanis]